MSDAIRRGRSTTRKLPPMLPALKRLHQASVSASSPISVVSSFSISEVCSFADGLWNKNRKKMSGGGRTTAAPGGAASRVSRSALPTDCVVVIVDNKIFFSLPEVDPDVARRPPCCCGLCVPSSAGVLPPRNRHPSAHLHLPMQLPD